MKTLIRYLFSCALSALLIASSHAAPFPFSFFKASGGGGGGGGSPTPITSDNFNAYDHLETLDSQTDWNAVSGVMYVQDASGNKRVFSATPAQFNGCINVTAGVTAMTANQRVEGTVTGFDFGAYIGVGVRLGSSTGLDGYIIRTNGTGIYVEKVLAGAVSQTFYSNASASPSSGTLFRLDVTGADGATRVNAYIDTDGAGGADWVQIVTDGVPTGTHINGGKPGVIGYASGDSFVDDVSIYQLP